MSQQHNDLSNDPARIQVPLRRIAYARSGDKGIHANIGVIARTPAGYEILERELKPANVAEFFDSDDVKRYELPNLRAVNFVLHGVLANNLIRDAQGKSLGQRLLELPLELTVQELDGARGKPANQTNGGKPSV